MSVQHLHHVLPSANDPLLCSVPLHQLHLVHPTPPRCALTQGAPPGALDLREEAVPGEHHSSSSQPPQVPALPWLCSCPTVPISARCAGGWGIWVSPPSLLCLLGAARLLAGR